MVLRRIFPCLRVHTHAIKWFSIRHRLCISIDHSHHLTLHPRITFLAPLVAGHPTTKLHRGIYHLCSHLGPPSCKPRRCKDARSLRHFGTSFFGSSRPVKMVLRNVSCNQEIVSCKSNFRLSLNFFFCFVNRLSNPSDLRRIQSRSIQINFQLHFS